jgi:hypothetical protein
MMDADPHYRTLYIKYTPDNTVQHNIHITDYGRCEDTVIMNWGESCGIVYKEFHSYEHHIIPYTYHTGKKPSGSFFKTLSRNVS